MSQPLPIGRKTDDECKFMEAFCLMLYQCDGCKKVETIYNTRDGVTSMFIGCDQCKDKMAHIAWYNDLYVPTFEAPDGMRIFVDRTKWMAEESTRKRIDESWTKGEYPMKDHFETKEQAFESLMSGFQEGQPAMVTKGGEDE